MTDKRDVFTPGPWLVGQDGWRPAHHIPITTGKLCIAEVYGTPIEEFGPDEITETDRANAALISAAPDMLAVLRAVEFVGERDLEDGYVPAACPFCQGEMAAGHEMDCALAAAIAKAEGR